MTHNHTRPPEAFYWQWWDMVDKNTDRLATRRTEAHSTQQLALFIPPDPEFAACFYHDDKQHETAY